jgi:hypothetical protein
MKTAAFLSNNALKVMSGAGPADRGHRPSCNLAITPQWASPFAAQGYHKNKLGSKTCSGAKESLSDEFGDCFVNRVREGRKTMLIQG